MALENVRREALDVVLLNAPHYVMLAPRAPYKAWLEAQKRRGHALVSFFYQIDKEKNNEHESTEAREVALLRQCDTLVKLIHTFTNFAGADVGQRDFKVGAKRFVVLVGEDKDPSFKKDETIYFLADCRVRKVSRVPRRVEHVMIEHAQIIRRFDRANADDPDLKSLWLPMCEEVGPEALRNRVRLSRIALPAVKSIRFASFYKCGSLTTIWLPVATQIGEGAFKSCRSLTTALLPAVTRLDFSAFSGCKSLTTISFPAVTEIGDHAFWKCTSLKTISLPAVTKIGEGAFFTCKSLKTISLPTVTEIGEQAFGRCLNLATVTLDALQVMHPDAFMQCGSLTTLVFNGVARNFGYSNSPRWVEMTELLERAGVRMERG